jgi:hypothetical protein
VCKPKAFVDYRRGLFCENEFTRILLQLRKAAINGLSIKQKSFFTRVILRVIQAFRLSRSDLMPNNQKSNFQLETFSVTLP